MFSDNRKIIGSVAATLAALLIAAAPASGTLPGDNGRITFMRRDDAGLWQLWQASSDLRQQTQLTAENANSGWPVWAPDGRRIAFDSDRADPDPSDDAAINDIFTIRPNGSGLVKLTPSNGFSGDATYSPDGRTIAFDSDQGDYPAKQGIYTMSAADGSHVRRVTRLPAGAANDLAPRFSPDGRRMVFTRYRSVDRGEGQPPEEPAALYVVNADGSHLRRLTDFDLKAGDADWSPDGRWIVFETNYDEVENQPADIYIVKPDGSRLTNLTHNSGRTDDGFRFSSDPVWSPDGTTIMFLDGRFTADSGESGLATMKPNGTQRTFVPTADAPDEHQVDWESLRTRR